VDELGSQSADFVPAESNIGRLTQLVDSRTYSESGTLDFHSETQSTKNYHNLHQGQSTAAPAIVMPASSTEPIDLPVLEVARPAPGRQQAEQSERIVRSAVARAQPSGRIDKRMSAVQTIVTPASSTEPIDSPVLEVAHQAPGRQQAEQSERIVRSAGVQAQSSRSMDRLEQQTSKASPNPVGRREHSELTDLVARRENEWKRPIERIENPKGEKASSLTPRALSHREIGTFSEPTETEPLLGRKVEVTTKSWLAPAPRKERPQPLGDRMDPQFGMARAMDAPTIQVTIGRVEIRATVASAPTRKTPTQKPVMGLDEYLKQRNGSRG
jgi:hypothetical protein